ncbi:hypothetical protein ABZY31_27045 [Streptomyces sp. NPDC006529]
MEILDPPELHRFAEESGEAPQPGGPRTIRRGNDDEPAREE